MASSSKQYLPPGSAALTEFVRQRGIVEDITHRSGSDLLMPYHCGVVRRQVLDLKAVHAKLCIGIGHDVHIHIRPVVALQQVHVPPAAAQAHMSVPEGLGCHGGITPGKGEQARAAADVW
jgi:hypothetical protein